MPEKTTQPEDTVQSAVRMGNEVLDRTTKYYANALEMTIRQSMDLSTRALRLMDYMMTSNRQMYSEGLKTWEVYMNDLGKMFIPPSR